MQGIPKFLIPFSFFWAICSAYIFCSLEKFFTGLATGLYICPCTMYILTLHTTYINPHKISDTGDYMFGLGTQEIILIMIIVLLLFGANKLPELARSLGVSVREFKKAMKEIEEDTED